jgi:3-methyladenine DNA glycosylase/8-oxoguanine DNA glycosylase
MERRRADILRTVARHHERLEEAAAMDREGAMARLSAVPGVGPWTTAQVLAEALGDPDAVAVGDYHLPHLVSWALAGEPRATDERMLELLEPYEGQRLRAVELLIADGWRPPRFGPRQRLFDITSF